MGFTTTSRIVLSTKVLAAGVIDGNESGAWYNSNFSNEFILDAKKVWSQISSIPQASSLAIAQSNASANPSLISDLSALGSAVRLTKIPGTNDSTYVAYSVYNNRTSSRLDNWINPAQIPRTDVGFEGFLSVGYQIRLFEGDPNSGGTEIFTTVGETGVGENRTQGWVWNYALGMLMVAADTRTTITNPYVLGFRYIGQTLADVASGGFSEGQHLRSVHSGGTITSPSTFLYTGIFGAENPDPGDVNVYINGVRLDYNASNVSISPWIIEGGNSLRLRPQYLNHDIEDNDVIQAYLLT